MAVKLTKEYALAVGMQSNWMSTQLLDNAVMAGLLNVRVAKI